VLQYWYLYLFNDAPNKHEGDWEMVAIELDSETLEPQQVGYSGHEGGARRAWAGVHRNGERPYVFVARGSHAAYLDHMPEGHHTQSVNFAKGLPLPLELVVGLVQSQVSRLIYGLGVRDWTCKLPGTPGKGEEGEVVDPEIELLPAEVADVRDNDAHWWMNLNCMWGSGRSRVTGFVAPTPPWTRPDKWGRPLTWVRGLKEHPPLTDTPPGV
jgi:hypothetical protein